MHKRAGHFFPFCTLRHSTPAGTASELRPRKAVFLFDAGRLEQEEGNMKTVTTILAAAFIAGTASLALAQGGGAAGGGGSDVNPDRLGKGADQNPSSPGSNPAAGNKDAT